MYIVAVILHILFNTMFSMNVFQPVLMDNESSEQNISDPTKEEWRNAKPYSAVPGPTGLPYVGRLYHYKLGGE